ncbi:MAG TPA: hypothetical protein VGO00_02205 [Kofleriaceae bacterium]|nr:hypothetical protein [Kofleriaceae bacterium]
MRSKAFRQPPSLNRPVGFEIAAPDTVEIQITPGAMVRWAEVREGRTVGELEVAPFSAALILDRDGILEEKVRGVAGATATIPIQLPNASGFRAATVGASSAPLPYLYVFAFAPLGVDGGVLVIVRSAQPSWAAADAILGSLRLLTRGGVANDVGDTKLPLVTASSSGRRTDS